MIGRLHESWLFRGGVMVTGEVDLSAGPLWASAPDELLPSWLASTEPAPFDQVHGHSSTVDWATGREYGQPELSGLISEDTVCRHATAIVEGRRIIGIDPVTGAGPPRRGRRWCFTALTSCSGQAGCREPCTAPTAAAITGPCRLT